MPSEPIFIHSLFRSGSTYLYNSFQRSTDPEYYCYQEPLNEVVHRSRLDTARLSEESGDGPNNQALRHPRMTRGYYQSMIETQEAWQHMTSPGMSYTDAFNLGDPRGVDAFLTSLIKAAPHRPVIQECRTVWRSALIKERLGGKHIHLWRNPWDQWWSYKNNVYFESANQLLLAANPRPPILDVLRARIHYQAPPTDEPAEQFHHFSTKWPSAEASYLTFYTLWFLAELSARQSCDFEINIDSLSASKAYRDERLASLSDLGIEGLDFSDCKTPQAHFDEKDEAFFLPLEKEVEEWISKSSFSSCEIAAVKAARVQYAPKHLKLSDNALSMAVTTSQMRQLVLKIQTHADHTVRTNAHVLHAQIAEMLANAGRLEGRIEAQGWTLKQTEQSLKDQEQLLERQWRTLEEQERILESLTLTLEEEQLRVKQERSHAEDLLGDLTRLEESRVLQQSRLLSKQQIIASMAKQADLLLANASQLTAQIRQSEDALNAVYRSSSWKVTAPLRGLRTLCGRKVRFVRSLLSRAARKGVLILVPILNSVPVLKKTTMKILQASPRGRAATERLVSMHAHHKQTSPEDEGGGGHS